MAVSGVQFDKMKVSPEQDALLYQHLSANSDRIINGYKNSLKVSSSGLNIYIDTGAALVQGRLVTVDELEKLTVEANTSGYVCLTIDLTQTNTSTGTPGSADYQPVNNQVRAEILGSLIQQDLKNDGKIFTFPLASYTAAGTSVALETFKHQGLSKGEVLWTGNLIMTSTHRITPSKKLSECENGWILKWARYNPTTGAVDPLGFRTEKITKFELGYHIFGMEHAGENIRSKKLISINDTLVSGDSSNSPGTVGTGAVFQMVLIEIKSW